MKILFSILSLAMLYISCLPCGDKKECNVRTEAKFSASNNNNHQQHKHNSEACSPFCSCSCCAASAFYSPFFKAQVNKIEFQSQSYPVYSVSFSTEVHNGIWQPPKLS